MISPFEANWLKCIPEFFRNISLESCLDIPPNLVADALKFITANPPFSLFFYGKWGAGKTTLAFALIRHLMQTLATRGYFWPNYITGKELDSRFLKATKSDGGDSWEIEKWSISNLLFIDDIDKVTATDRFKFQLFEIINYRMINNLPSIITSNLQPDEMSQIFDGALVSRIGDQTKWKCLRFPPKDLRKIKVLEYE